jgi:hypothetical protein
VLPSLNVPVAVNWVVPVVSATVGSLGVIVMWSSGKAVTTRDAVEEPSSFLAVIVAVPAATAVAMPELDTVATLVFDEVQVALEVTSLVSPFTVVPVAV